MSAAAAPIQPSKFKKANDVPNDPNHNGDHFFDPNYKSATQYLKNCANLKKSLNLSKSAIEESKNEGQEESFIDHNFGGGAGNMKQSGDEQRGDAPSFSK